MAAVPIFTVFALGGFFGTLQGFSDTVFILRNRQIWSFYNILVQTILAVLMFFPIRRLGQDYLAVPFIAPYAVTFPFLAVLVSRLVGLSLSEWLIAIMPSLASSALMFGAVKLMSFSVHFSSDLSQAAFCSAFGAGVYLIAMLMLSRRTVVSAFHLLWGLV
jgi:hypothetical protein